MQNQAFQPAQAGFVCVAATSSRLVQDMSQAKFGISTKSILKYSWHLSYSLVAASSQTSTSSANNFCAASIIDVAISLRSSRLFK